MSQFALQWAESLLRASIQGGIAVIVLAIVFRLLKSVPAAVQVWAWRLVLAKFFVTLLLPIPIQAGLVAAGTGPSVQPLLPLVVLGLSAACASLVAISIVRDLILIRRLRRRAVRDDLASEELARMGRSFGLKSVPEAFTTASIHTPMLAGCGKPAVLLPAGFREEYGLETWRMVLAHELAHFKRRDLWWTWFTSAVKAVFFFHPLVNWAIAEMNCAEEAACDDIAVRMSGAQRVEYGLMLVRLSTMPNLPIDKPVAATAMGRGKQVKRRIHIFVAEKRRHRRLMSALVLLAVLASVPGYTLVSKTAEVPVETWDTGPVFSPAMKFSAHSRERRNTLIETFPQEGIL